MSDRTDGIAVELLALQNERGLINPADVVEWARRHPKSRLHASLEWEDAVAAERYRVWQVRSLIAIHVTDQDGVRQFVSLSIDRRTDGTNGYRPVADVIRAPDLREVMLADALADLERVQARYSRLVELEAVWQQADVVRKRRRSPRPEA